MGEVKFRVTGAKIVFPASSTWGSQVIYSDFDWTKFIVWNWRVVTRFRLLPILTQYRLRTQMVSTVKIITDQESQTERWPSILPISYPRSIYKIIKMLCLK